MANESDDLDQFGILRLNLNMVPDDQNLGSGIGSEARRNPPHNICMVFRPRATPERRLAKAAYLSHHWLVIIIIGMGVDSI